MTRPKNPQPAEPKAPAPRRESGFLICATCALSIPYQGYDGEPSDARPQHRCVRARGVQPFDKFDTKLPKVKVRQW